MLSATWTFTVIAPDASDASKSMMEKLMHACCGEVRRQKRIQSGVVEEGAWFWMTEKKEFYLSLPEAEVCDIALRMHNCIDKHMATVFLHINLLPRTNAEQAGVAISSAVMSSLVRINGTVDVSISQCEE